MDVDQQVWQVWANFLQRWGVTDWAASLLEAIGPLSIFGAQAVYLSQPLFNNTSAQPHLDAMARLLEDKGNTRSFVEFLREASLQ